MSTEEQYQSWLQKRRRVGVAPDFADRVMGQLAPIERPTLPVEGKAQRTLDWFAAHLLARAALILLAVAAAIAQGALLLRVGLG